MPKRNTPFDAAFWALAALGAGWVRFISRWLVYPDLNLDYPFTGGDGLDWIANALALAGEPVRYSGRAPLVPAILAALDRVGLMPWFPVFSQALLVGLALAIYALARSRFSTAIAGAVGLATLASLAIQDLALAIGADLLATVLFTAAAAAWVRGSHSSFRGALGWRTAAGLFVGLSAITQPLVALALVPAAAVASLGQPRGERGSALAWVVPLALAIAPFLLWRFLGPEGSGEEGLVGVRQASLIAPSVRGLGFYAREAVTRVGWPGMVLVLGGTAIAAARWRADWTARFALSLAAIVGVFFGVLYGWRDGRFLIYGAPAGALLVGFALERLARRQVAGPLGAAALVLGAALPPAVRGWSDTVPDKVHTAWRAFDHAAAPPSIAKLPSDRSAVLIMAPGTPIEVRYRDQTRLGNALRLRVKPVPAELYAADWWGWGFLEPLPSVAGRRVARWRWKGDSWIVIDPPPLPVTARNPPDDVGDEWSLAAEMARPVATPDGLLAVLGDPAIDGGWLRLLPFAAGTSSLFVIVDPAEQRALLPSLAVAAGSRRRVGPAEAWHSDFKGWPVEVLVSDAASKGHESLR